MVFEPDQPRPLIRFNLEEHFFHVARENPIGESCPPDTRTWIVRPPERKPSAPRRPVPALPMKSSNRPT